MGELLSTPLGPQGAILPENENAGGSVCERPRCLHLVEALAIIAARRGAGRDGAKCALV